MAGIEEGLREVDRSMPVMSAGEGSQEAKVPLTVNRVVRFQRSGAN